MIKYRKILKLTHFSLSFSLPFSPSRRRAAHLHRADGVAVDYGLLPRRCPGQLYAVRVGVLVAGKTSGGLRVAHGGQGRVCDSVWAADWRYPGLDRQLSDLHPRAVGVHFHVRCGVVRRVCDQTAAHQEGCGGEPECGCLNAARLG